MRDGGFFTWLDVLGRNYMVNVAYDTKSCCGFLRAIGEAVLFLPVIRTYHSHCGNDRVCCCCYAMLLS